MPRPEENDKPKPSDARSRSYRYSDGRHLTARDTKKQRQDPWTFQADDRRRSRHRGYYSDHDTPKETARRDEGPRLARHQSYQTYVEPYDEPYVEDYDSSDTVSEISYFEDHSAPPSVVDTLPASSNDQSSTSKHERAGEHIIDRAATPPIRGYTHEYLHHQIQPALPGQTPNSFHAMQMPYWALPPVGQNTRSFNETPFSTPGLSHSIAGHPGYPRIPHLSVPQYRSDYTAYGKNPFAPVDSKSDAESHRDRLMSGSTTSVGSTTLLSAKSSASTSGVLGPKTYQYCPLKDMEFRLVRILPERMSKLRCEILHRSLQETPEYIAISYAWGDGVDTKQLMLGEAAVPVSANLFDALKAVRQKKEEALVWVDALCIDQNNKDERADQVRLMGLIYSRAVAVAIWLGPQMDESELAIQLLEQVALNAVTSKRIRAVSNNKDSAALLALFKREYWSRLWVVQEVFLAVRKMVYCGYSVLPWEVYKQAGDAFWDRESDLHIRQGPSSFPDMSTMVGLGDHSLLEVMRACRKKFSENPRDKVFGILGMLPEDIQRDFPVDYSQSVKTVYTDVVDHLIHTTHRLDVIREAIHFPLHVNSSNLPSWCPDWSHIPEVSGLSPSLGFNATGDREAEFRFHDERRKLEITCIELDTVSATGVAVGTFCAAQDYLSAFLNWRALFLDALNINAEEHPLHEAFCKTLCLGQVPEKNTPRGWVQLCYHVFSSLIHDRMPRMPMDQYLDSYKNLEGLIEPTTRRKFLQAHFGNRMMGRNFCITEKGLIGMGSGYMTRGDLIVVPFGCATPVLLRPTDRRKEYRFVGDIYVDGYMHGEAVDQMGPGKSDRTRRTFMVI